MTVVALCDGSIVQDPAHAVAVDDRGLNYGDGLFETALLRDGMVRFADAHLQRLEQGCNRLGIRFSRSDVERDIARIASEAREGVLKVVVTRGVGGRGYRGDPSAPTRRIVTLHPLPSSYPVEGLTVRWCELRLSRNPLLAGMKHLNRLEQVLAQNEWQDPDVAEGLMLDTEGELVCGTSSNVFIVRNGALLTPDLKFSGVRGVMRAQVLRAAQQLGWTSSEEPLWPHDLDDVSEVFVTNAVRGIRSVAALEDHRWESTAVAGQLRQVLLS
ncbi:4-amino-4-deoxychorismate lyase [Povalibacter uvarum]|uniref:Aminodeoxychorismate lyase n=1 Tax=Povalibacter uvarum TaxID=732238 RepID=A0A841HIH6_9GAMM|nr:aminodeoxychorismate lyase [Povalibacter uvarum]MBB6092100.1 4-amino-4-deoxychorismate lyase [Povalibacter uvarum]